MTADVIFFLSKPESEMRFIYHEQISVDVSFHRPTTSKEARIQLYSHDSIIIEWNDHAIHNVLRKKPISHCWKLVLTESVYGGLV